MSLQSRLNAFVSRASSEFKTLKDYGGYASTHRSEILKERFIARNGGSIGTGGLSAVAIRLDHDTDAIDNLIPIHQKYGIPAGWALYSQQRSDPANTSNKMVWSSVQDRALKNGLEPWYHTRTHTDATTISQWNSEIILGKSELQSYMPKVVIDGFIPAGVGGTSWGGFMATNTPEHFYDMIPGRMIMDNFAVSTGHMGGAFRVLDGKIIQGAAHNTIERDTAETTIGRIKAAQEMGGVGLCLMLHPRHIGTAGYMSLADYDAVLAYIAQERDAGRLVNLSLSGLTIADSSHSRRVNLINNGNFLVDGPQSSAIQPYGWTTGVGDWIISDVTNVSGGVGFFPEGTLAATTTITGAWLEQSINVGNAAWAKGATLVLSFDLWQHSGTSANNAQVTITAGSNVVVRNNTIYPGAAGRKNITIPFMVPTDVGSEIKVRFTKASSSGRQYFTNVKLTTI